MPPTMEMFPNHPASEHCNCSSTKSSYLLRYGIAEVLFEEIKNDVIDVPYTVKFDESNTSQMKKQLDICVSYCSKIYDQVCKWIWGILFYWSLYC